VRIESSRIVLARADGSVVGTYVDPVRLSRSTDYRGETSTGFTSPLQETLRGLGPGLYTLTWQVNGSASNRATIEIVDRGRKRPAATLERVVDARGRVTPQFLLHFRNTTGKPIDILRELQRRVFIDGKEATFAPRGGIFGSIIGPLRSEEWWVESLDLDDYLLKGKPVGDWRSIVVEIGGVRTNVVTNQPASPSRKPRR